MHNLPLGVALSLLAAFVYSLQTALIKAFAGILPPLPVVIFIQSVVCFLCFMPLLFQKGFAYSKKIITTPHLKLHVLRTIFSLSISYLLFYAVTFIPLVNGMLLANTAPLFVPFLAFFFMRQSINHRLWVPILIGYTGVILVLHPTHGFFNVGSLLALGAGLVLSSSLLTVRHLTTREKVETTAFYFFLLSALFSGIISIPFWTTINLHMLFIMATVGIFYFLTQYLTTFALKYVNPQLVSALFYSNIIYAALISYFFWHAALNFMTILGIIFIITGGSFCILVEHTVRLRDLKLKRLVTANAQEL